MKIMNDIDEFEISLYHINYIGIGIVNTIEAFSGIIDKVEKEHEAVLYLAIRSVVLNQIVSFLDEYHNYLKSADPESNEMITAIKNALNPVVNRIIEWKEMTIRRSGILGHNLRDPKNKRSLLLEEDTNTYNIPQKRQELFMLSECISIIKRAFVSVFGIKLLKVQFFIDKMPESRLKDKLNNYFESDVSVDRILKEINESLFKCTYRNTILGGTH